MRLQINRKVNILMATDTSQMLIRKMKSEKGRMKTKLATAPNIPGTPNATDKKMDKKRKRLSYLAKARYNLIVVWRGNADFLR